MKKCHFNKLNFLAMHSKIMNSIIFRYVSLGCLLCVIVITLLLDLSGVYEMSPLKPPPIKNTGDITLTLQPQFGHNHGYIVGKF